MRKFNEREQEIIKILCSIEIDNFDFINEVLKKKYFTKSSNQLLIIDNVTNNAYLYLKKEIYDVIEERKKETYVFTEFIFLLQYLKENRYISTISDIKIKEEPVIIIKESFVNPPLNQGKIILNENEDYILTDPPNPEIFNKNGAVIYKGISLDYGNFYKMITENLLGVTFVSEELKYLTHNNFETEEEKRFKETLKIGKKHFKITQIISWVSIGIAIILGLIGVFNKKTSIVKIEESQYKQAIQQVDEMKNQLKTYESKIDSLKIQINNNALPQKSPL
jgi:hypothetical protein